MALQGIRLNDIHNVHGYSDSEFNAFVNNNMESINSQLAVRPGSTADGIAQDLYLDSLIRSAAGDEAFVKNARGRRREDKIAYYNSLFKEEPSVSEMPSNVNDITGEIGSQFGDNSYSVTTWKPNSQSTLFEQGDIAPFKYSAFNENPMSMYDFFAAGFGSKALEGVDVAHEMFNKIYNPLYQRVSEDNINLPSTQESIDRYAIEIRNSLDSDRKFAFETFSEFDNAMRKISPYYNSCHDTNLLPITPNEMKDIMAQYMAINTIKGYDEANKFAIATFQNIAAENQGFWAKLGNSLPNFCANYSGNLIATAGIFLNTIEGIKHAFSKEHEIDGVNWFQEFLYYAADNPITRYGNLCSETGTWIPEEQKTRHENGLNRYAMIRRYGHESDFWDVNTLFELPIQGAFTFASMLSGSLTTSFLKGTIGKVTDKVSRKLMTDGAKRITRLASKGVDILGDAIVIGGTSMLPAAAEASVDAFEEYDNIMSGNFRQLDDKVNDIFEEDVENGNFLRYLYSKHPLRLPSDEERGKMTQEDIDRLMSEFHYNYNLEAENYKNEIKESLLNLPGAQEELRETALRGAMRNMYDETMFISFGDALFTKVLGGGFKAAKNRIMSNMGIRSSYGLRRGANEALEVFDKSNFWNRYFFPVIKGVNEANEEGIEETFQHVDNQLRLELAGDYFVRWINNRHDQEALKDLDDSFKGFFSADGEIIRRNLLSDEARFSYLMGAVSAGIGQPTLANGIRSSIIARQAGEKRGFWDVFSSYLRNPIVENVLDARNEHKKRLGEIEDINKWLANHEETARIQDFNSLFSWLQQQTNSATNNNESDFRDEIMGQKVATLMMMDRIGGSAKEHSFNKKLRTMANLSYSSNEAQQLIDQALIGQDISDATEEKRKEVFDDIVSKAQDMVDLQNRIHDTRRWVSSNFAEVLSDETIDALTYEMLMHNDLADRIKSVNKTVQDAWNSNVKDGDSQASTSSSDLENAYAKYGNLTNAEKRLSDLQEQLKTVKKSKKALLKRLGQFGYQHYLDTVKDDIKSTKEDVETMKRTEGEILLTAEKIAGLSSEARAEILNEDNYSQYSKEQKAQIDRFKNNAGITNDVLDSIKDAAKLQKKYDTYTTRFNSYQRDARKATLYSNEIKRKALMKFAENALSDALTANTYEEFKEAADEFFNNPENDYLSSVSNDVLKDSKFFKEYLKELNNRMSASEIMQNSPEFNNLTEQQQRALIQAHNKALADDDTSFDNIFKYLSDDKLMAQFGLSREDINNEDYINSIRNILSQINNFKNTTEALDAQRKRLSERQKEQQKQPQTPREKEDNKKILSKNIYVTYKDKIDALIPKISNYLKGRINKSPLSNDEFLTLMKLFGKEEFTYDFLIDDIIPSLSEKDLNTTLERLIIARDNTQYNDENAINSVKFKNTVTLINSIERLLNLYSFNNKIGINKNIKDFIKDSLKNLNPSWNSILSDKKVKGKSTNLKTLGTYSILSESGVSTDAERKYYESHNITENINTLAKLNMSLSASDGLQTVFIYDKELGAAILEELGEEAFSSDNLPLIAAVAVKGDVPNAITVDGLKVLPIGMLGQSRTAPMVEEVNSLNVLRQMAIDRGQEGIIRNADNTFYRSKGVNLNFAKQDLAISESLIRDQLITKHNGNREKAFDDFQRNVVGVEFTIDHSTRMVTGSYFYNGKPYKIGPYPAKEGTWTDMAKDTHQMNAYIDESHPDVPYLLMTRRDIINEDIDGINLLTLLSNDDNLSSTDYVRQDINNIASAVKYISDQLKGNISAVIRYGDAKIGDRFLSDIITEYIDKHYLNMARKSRQNPSVRLKFNYENGQLKAYLDSDYTGKEEISSVDIGKGGISNDELYLFAKRTIRGLIFDNDGKVRINPDSNESLIKLQVKDYDVRKKDDNKDIGYQRRVFNAGLYVTGKLSDSVKVESISVNETNQRQPSNTGDKVKDASDNLSKFVLTDKEKQRAKGSIGVTTFIKGRKVELDNPTVSDKVKMNLGTSVDKLVRVYFQNGRSLDGVKNWMREKGLATWPGIGGSGNEEFVSFVKQIKKIEDFFEKRGEMPVTEEHIFSGEIIGTHGHSAKLTAIPDIITIDKNGKYHIYDMKTFKYTPGAMAIKDGFNNVKNTFKGMNKDEDSTWGWREQLTLYKVMMEQALGKDSVASIGIIPIALNYTLPPRSSVGPKVISAIGEEVTEMNVPKGDKSDEMVPLHIKSDKTIIYNDFIKFEPISDIETIAPEMWREESKTNMTLQDVRDSIKPKQDSDVSTIAEIIPLQAPVEKKTINELNANDIESMLFDDEDFDTLDRADEVHCS